MLWLSHLLLLIDHHHCPYHHYRLSTALFFSILTCVLFAFFSSFVKFQKEAIFENKLATSDQLRLYESFTGSLGFERQWKRTRKWTQRLALEDGKRRLLGLQPQLIKLPSIQTVQC
ncbi:hypothetical protein LINPERHAP2_LOCUS44067 [Linum perenne]